VAGSCPTALARLGACPVLVGADACSPERTQAGLVGGRTGDRPPLVV